MGEQDEVSAVVWTYVIKLCDLNQLPLLSVL